MVSFENLIQILHPAAINKLDLLSVVSSSTPQTRFVNSQLVSCPQFGILKQFMFYL